MRVRAASRWLRAALIGFLMTAAVLGLQGGGWAGDWPGWRGPTGLGYTDEKALPLTWNGKTGENVVWKVQRHECESGTQGMVAAHRHRDTASAGKNSDQFPIGDA